MVCTPTLYLQNLLDFEIETLQKKEQLQKD